MWMGKTCGILAPNHLGKSGDQGRRSHLRDEKAANLAAIGSVAAIERAGPASEKSLAGPVLRSVTWRRGLLSCRRFPCAPSSNRGSRLADRPVARMVQLWADRNPSKSQACPAKEPMNGSQIPPDRSSLPDGSFYNVSGSSNRVPERTPDPQS
jgi:hypothetical protein